MTNPFEKTPSAEQKEKMTYLGQAVFGFDENLKIIIDWLGASDEVLNEKDVLILTNPGKKDEILRLTIGIHKKISQPLEIKGIGETLPLNILDPKDRKKKFILDVYKIIEHK